MDGASCSLSQNADLYEVFVHEHTPRRRQAGATRITGRYSAARQRQLLEQLKQTEDSSVRRTILLKLEVIKRQQEKGVEAYRASKARLEG
jgi:hypothetical protein